MRSVSMSGPLLLQPLSSSRNVPRSPLARHNGRMRHTFLFEPAVWIATGTFWRGDGEPLEAGGPPEIAHRARCWLLGGRLKAPGAPPVEFVHAYLIEPPVADGNVMKWTFETETFGKLAVTYVVVERSI